MKLKSVGDTLQFEYKFEYRQMAPFKSIKFKKNGKISENKRNTDHDFPPPFMWAESNKTPVAFCHGTS